MLLASLTSSLTQGWVPLLALLTSFPEQALYVTAGGFTYTAGSGTGGSAGNYTYMDAHDEANPIFEPYNLNWQGYCKPSENPSWGSGACRGGGGGGGGQGW